MIIGGLIACSAFFMPWFSACGQEATGAQIAAHPERYEMPGEDSSSWVLLWLVLVAAGCLVLIGVVAQRNLSVPGVIASLLGSGLVVLSYVSIEDKSLVEIRYGFWVELAGFGVALAGALRAYSSAPRRATASPTTSATDLGASDHPRDGPGA